MKTSKDIEHRTMKKTRDKLKRTTRVVQKVNVSTKERIRKIVMENDTREGRIFDISIQLLILFSLIVYSVGTLPNLSPMWKSILDWVDLVCYIVFTIEYFSRIYIAKRPFKYIFSFYGIIDFLAILPFLFSRSFDLRALRALRVLRVISALKISRYSESLQRFAIAIRIIKPELTLFLIVSNVFIFLSASGIYYFEQEAQPEHFASIFHSLWWAIITLTTVGYGDVYPVTWGGRAFTYVILLIGLGIITIPTGLIASALGEAREVRKQELEDEEANPDTESDI